MSEELNIYPKETKTIRKLVDNNMPVMVIGEAGLGKSKTSEFAVEDLPHTSVNLSKQHDLVDLVGQYVLEKDIGKGGEITQSFVFKHGKVTQAAEEGQVLILEELTMADPTVLSAFHGLSELPPKLHTIQGDIDVHPDFRLIGTANPSWTNYQGVLDLNYAFEDRFAHIIFDFPSKDKIMKFLEPYEKNFVKRDIDTEDLYNCAKYLFKSYPNTITSYLSLRGIKFFAMLLKDFSIIDSMNMAYLNKSAPDERGQITDVIDNFIPIAGD